MKRKFLRYLIATALVAASGFAAWTWLRPYAWVSDPAAGCKILEALITRDSSYYWLEVHLKVSPGVSFDLQQPVVLESGTGKKTKPANMTLGSIDGRQADEIWVKFWLEPTDLAGPVSLLINEGKLIVRTGTHSPDLGNSGYRNFTTNHW